MAIRELGLAAGLVLSASAAMATTSPFGAAAGYNAFVLGNMTSSNSDTEGRLGVGGNANLSGYAVGAALANSNGTDNRLVVGGNLTFVNGQVYGGNARYAGTASISGLGVPNGTLTPGASPVNFTATGQLLRDLSTSVYGLARQGTTTVNSGQVTFLGTGARNVFEITAAQLASANTINFNVASAATVIVNVRGTTASVQNAGIALNGLSSSRILWNFGEATGLTLSGIGFEGSVLAAKALVNFNNGQLNGQLFAGSFSGNGQLNNQSFTGVIDVVPLPPAAWAGLGCMAMVVAHRRLRSRRA